MGMNTTQEQVSSEASSMNKNYDLDGDKDPKNISAVVKLVLCASKTNHNDSNRLIRPSKHC